MFDVIYYEKANGERPARDWLDGLDAKHKATAFAKIAKLRENGLLLLKTNMLVRLADSELYELKGGQCRIAVYHDRDRDLFVLLHGWVKKKRTHPADIKIAESYLSEYLPRGRGRG